MEEPLAPQQRSKHSLLTRVSTLHQMHPRHLSAFDAALLQALLVSASNDPSSSCVELACAVCVVARSSEPLVKEIETWLETDVQSLLEGYRSCLQSVPPLWLRAPPELLFAVCVAEVNAPEHASAARTQEFVHEAKLSMEPAAEESTEAFVQASNYLVTVLQRVRSSKPQIFKQLYRALQQAIQPPAPETSSVSGSVGPKEDHSDRASEDVAVQMLFPVQIEFSAQDTIALLLNVTRIAMTLFDGGHYATLTEAPASYAADIQLACAVVHAVGLTLQPSAVAGLIDSHIDRLHFTAS